MSPAGYGGGESHQPSFPVPIRPGMVMLGYFALLLPNWLSVSRVGSTCVTKEISVYFMSGLGG